MSASWSLEAMMSFGRGALLMLVERKDARSGIHSAIRAFAPKLHGHVLRIRQNVFAQLDLDRTQGVAHEQALGDFLREGLDEMARAGEAERFHKLADGKVIDRVFDAVIERTKIADRLQHEAHGETLGRAAFVLRHADVGSQLE